MTYDVLVRRDFTFLYSSLTSRLQDSNLCNLEFHLCKSSYSERSYVLTETNDQQ